MTKLKLDNNIFINVEIYKYYKKIIHLSPTFRRLSFNRERVSLDRFHKSKSTIIQLVEEKLSLCRKVNNRKFSKGSEFENRCVEHFKWKGGSDKTTTEQNLATVLLIAQSHSIERD